MKLYQTIILIGLIITACNGQPSQKAERNVGGPCEDCAALLDYKSLNPKPKSIDTLSGFEHNLPRLKITGKVFKKVGETPAANTILYIYHTNRKGVYEPSTQPKGWEKRHGQHRGWLKTKNDGTFTFYTFRPASYPNTQEPEHIHIYVKEPNTVPYYLDSYVFESDPKLTTKEKQLLKNRGGSGIVKLVKTDGIWTADRTIILGLNIPNYE